MKIYRIALNEDTVNKVNGRENLPFDNIFGSDPDILRKVIPLNNQALYDLINRLEDGDTKSETVYKVDLDNNIAYRFVVENGESIMDNRPMRIGKVIAKELGQEAANEWSVQANSKVDPNYSIVLSRSPVDVVRMSDHGNMQSCHSPDGDYFGHAVEEAIDGGAIAYVVKNSDLESFKWQAQTTDVADPINNAEIFNDPERGINNGINPISRARINRYVYDENGYGKEADMIELGLPVTRTYGDEIAGFVSSLTKWLHEEQSDSIDYDDMDLSEFKRTGGAYADVSDTDIVSNFFGKEMIDSDLEHSAGTTRVDIYNEELEAIVNEHAGSFPKTIDVFADAQLGEDQRVTVSAGCYMHFPIQGEWHNSINYGTSYGRGPRLDFNKTKWIYDLDVNSRFTVEDSDMETPQEGIVDVVLRVYFDDVYSPDDLQGYLSDLASYVSGGNYMWDLHTIRGHLVENNIVESDETYAQFGRDDYEEFFNQSIWNYDAGDEDLLGIEIPFNDGIGERNSEGVHSVLIQDQVKIAFEETIRQYIGDQFSENNPLSYGMIPVPHISVKARVVIADGQMIGIPQHAWLPDRPFKLKIEMSSNELVRLGMDYFKALNNITPKIIDAVTKAVWSTSNNQPQPPQPEVQSIPSVKEPVAPIEEEGVEEVMANLNWYEKSLHKEAKLINKEVDETRTMENGPISSQCMSCKKWAVIPDDADNASSISNQNYTYKSFEELSPSEQQESNQVERVSHGICPECYEIEMAKYKSSSNSWYAISRTAEVDTNIITEIANRVRSQMVTSYDDDTLQAQCLPVSRALAGELARNGINSSVVQGTFTIDNPDPGATEGWDVADFEDEQQMESAMYTPLHYWVEVLRSRNESENLIVDITATQFNDEIDDEMQILEMGSYAELGRYTPITRDWIGGK